MKQFLILLKGRSELDYSDKALKERFAEYRLWVDTIAEHYISDSRLERVGAHIKEKDNIRTDGPFVETKEIIAGFVVIKALNLERAIQIANGSPLLKYFELIVRPIVSQ